MTDLTDIMREIGALQSIHYRKSLPAPNDWEQYRDNLAHNRGTELEFDYETYDHGDTTVIYPVANCAIEWCVAHLPANCSRWGAAGYVLETQYVHLALNGMRRDGLISENEYVDNMEIAEQQKQHEANDFAEYQGEER